MMRKMTDRMEFITTELPENSTVVALGVFDGVHKGHREVLRRAVISEGLEPWVFTFSEKSLPTGKAGAKRLEPPEIKFSIMKACGIRHVYAPDFGDVKGLSGEEFVRDILCGKLRCKKVVCGTDYRFGYKAYCGTKEMAELCEKYGMEYCFVEKIYDKGEAISSTRIRAAAEAGNMPEVELLAGYPFCIETEVIRGNRLGREFGLPTINQPFAADYIIPKFGVYVSAAYIDGEFYPAVTNVGVKPTVSEDNIPAAETHIIGISADLYDRKIPVFLIDFVREEMVFENRDELFARIALDKSNAERLARKWIRTRGEETEKLLGM